MNSDKQLQQLQELFRSEATEYLEHMNQIVLQLETAVDENPELVRELFRVAHSLKGAARTVNHTDIEKVAHALETVFDALRSNKLVLSAEIADVLYDGLDSIQVLLSGNTEKLNLEAVVAQLGELGKDTKGDTKPFPPPARPLQTQPLRPFPDPEPPSDFYASDETIRVPVSKLDRLMTDVSNLLVSRMNIEERTKDIQALREQHHNWQKQWRRVNTTYIRLVRTASQNPALMAEWEPLLDFLQHTQRYMRGVGRQLATTEQTLNEDTLNLGFVTDALQVGVRDVRLLPFETIVAGLKRTVRDIARELGKDVMFHTVGTRIELDKQVLENIKDPLNHLLRNAIDHGIESPERREARGKPTQGLILLTLMQRGNKVHIILTDDGNGIDFELIRRRALSLGLISETEAQTLNESEILELLMLPGFSTSEKVSEISGRGVGLDVVHQKVEALQGQIRIESAVGTGTTFEIILPITLSTLHCILVRIGAEVYAIPTSTVVRVVEYHPETLFMVKGKAMLSLDDRPMPLAYLDDVLERGQRRDEIGPTALAVVLRAADRYYAFVVDDILSEQEVIVRNLNPEMVRVRNISGATLLANGEVVLILNVSDLIKSAQGKPIRRREVKVPDIIAPQIPRVLVVDDSITTRTLQKNILEAAGYEVLTATHGMEALEVLSSKEVDLVITDIEMPWMNGFDLTARIRKAPQTRNLPIILVTSLDAPEHKERGFAAGADAYIAKGVFDQNELLNTIQTLL